MKTKMIITKHVATQTYAHTNAERDICGVGMKIHIRTAHVGRNFY